MSFSEMAFVPLSVSGFVCEAGAISPTANLPDRLWVGISSPFPSSDETIVLSYLWHLGSQSPGSFQQVQMWRRAGFKDAEEGEEVSS